MNKLYLGIDVGTSSIKFLVTDSSLKKIYEKSKKYSYRTINKDWTEIDPSLWLNIIKEELKNIFSQSFSEDIIGICTTGQMHTTVFLDKQDEPVRNAIMWNDKRTKNRLDKIKSSIYENKKTRHLSNIVSTGMPLLNLLWVKENEPKKYNNIKKILTCKDYINYFLTGKHITDYCDASTSLFMNLLDWKWSPEILRMFDLDQSILPRIEHSSKDLGYLRNDVKNELNIDHDVKVFVGTGDNAATVVSTNNLSSNDLVVSLGSSGVILAPSNDELSKRGKNILFKAKESEQNIITQGSLSTGAKNLEWWISNILESKSFENEEMGIKQDDILDNDVLFFPHLNGEKYLFGNPNLNGSFIGLNLQTVRHDMNISILEGVAFALKELYTKIVKKSDYEQIVLIGGGSKSRLWIQTISNVFNLPVVNLKNSGEAVIGAIKIAIIGEENKKHSEKSSDYEIIEPIEKIVRHYEEKYVRYQEYGKLVDNFYS